jgi:hypothetical protein
MDNYSYKREMILSSLKLCDQMRKLDLKSMNRDWCDLIRRATWRRKLTSALLDVYRRAGRAELFNYVESYERSDDESQ